MSCDSLRAEVAAARATASAEVARRRMCAALETAHGNITRAAIILGISRSHAMRLIKRFDLGSLARDLRARAGEPVIGRPSVGCSTDVSIREIESVIKA